MPITEETVLETFPNPAPERDYTIRMQIPEFTCLCPKTGYPDFATITINYIPDEYCFELKSVKLYINKFRDVGIFHEEVVNKILEDLIEVGKPRWLQILGDFNPRGNVKTFVKTEYLKPGFEGRISRSSS